MGDKYRQQFFRSVSVLPSFLKGPPHTHTRQGFPSRLPGGVKERGPPASPRGSLCPASAGKQASGEEPERGARAAAEFSGQRGGDLRAAPEPHRGPELPPGYPKMPPGTGASRETPGAAETAPGPAPRPHGARRSPNPAPLQTAARAWELGAEPLNRNTFGDREAFEVSSVRTPNPPARSLPLSALTASHKLCSGLVHSLRDPAVVACLGFRGTLLWLESPQSWKTTTATGGTARQHDPRRAHAECKDFLGPGYHV